MFAVELFQRKLDVLVKKNIGKHSEVSLAWGGGGKEERKFSYLYLYVQFCSMQKSKGRVLDGLWALNTLFFLK
jgi:hypothetical protein